MLVVYVYLGYASLNIYDTPNLNSLAHITDAFALIQDVPQQPGQPHPLVANSPTHLADDAIPALYDLPLATYNRFTLGQQEG